MGFIDWLASTKLGKGLVATQDKLAGTKTEKALDFVSATALNPLSILSPGKASEKIKKMREDISLGDTQQAKSYIVGVAGQTALNAAAIVSAPALAARAAALPAATKAAALIKGAAIGAPALAAVAASPSIREFIATKGNPTQLAFNLATKAEDVLNKDDKEEKPLNKDEPVREKIKKKIKEAIKDTALISAGAGLGVLGKEIYDFFKDKKEDSAFQPQGATPVASMTPITPQTTSVNLGKEAGSGTTTRKRRKRSARKQTIPNINIRIDNRDDWDNTDRKIYKRGKY